MSEHTLQLGSAQAEMLTEIGAHLRYLRQDQDLSLETVATRTHIPVRTLRAIEEGNLSGLPEPVYVQGFIRRYADAIGMDGAEVANAFPTESILRYNKPGWRGRVEAQLRPFHLYMLYTLLVVGAVSGLSFVLNRSALSSTRYASLAQKAQIGGVLPEAYGPPLPSQVSTKTTAPKNSPASPSDKPIRVGLTLTDQSWLRVVVDGKTAFEGVLPQGTQRNWEANQQLVVRAGNAGGVMFSYNENKPKPIGDPGAVDEVTFDANSSANLTPGNSALAASAARTY